ERPLPLAEHLRAEGDDAMEVPEEVRKQAQPIGHDEVEMRRHGTERMDLDAINACREREDVEQDPGDVAVGAEEEVSAPGATGNQVRGAGEDVAKLAHGRPHPRKACQARSA